jgi:hypothetical protein
MLSEAHVLLLLLGRDKDDLRRGPFLRQLMFTADVVRDPYRFWATHETFLRAEAKRLQISPTFENAFLGRQAFWVEHLVATRDEVQAKWEYRQQHGDHDDRSA